MTGMATGNYEWLPMPQAAARFGYRHHVSLRRRIRLLRAKGLVIDLGWPPSGYRVGDGRTKGKVVIYWPNPKAALLRSDAPGELLNPRRGRRPA